MLNKIYIKIMLLLVGAALVTGCEKSGLQPYTGGNTVGFWVHSINHSFYGEGVETLPKDTIVLDLAITGDVVDYDRHVDGTFILDAAGTEEKDLKNTAVEGKDYKILGGVVKANEEYGEFMVEVYNTDELKEKELKLNLAIKENEDLVKTVPLPSLGAKKSCNPPLGEPCVSSSVAPTVPKCIKSLCK